MLFDLWNQLKMSAFTSITSQINFLCSSRVRKFESYVYSEVALPIMIVL